MPNMAIVIRNKYLQAKLLAEASERGVKTLSGIASDLITERMIQLETMKQSEPRKVVENGKAGGSASSDCSTCSQSMS